MKPYTLILLILLLPAPGWAADSPAIPSQSAPQQLSLANPWENLNPRRLKLRSKSALILDTNGRPVYERDSTSPMPIASITKLMTAIVILDSGIPLEAPVTITKQDRDLIQLTGSRLKYGATLPRGQMLQLALMASENRAAMALGRTYPGGLKAFVAAMNSKARELGMQQSSFSDPAGLGADNVASARDLALLIERAEQYPIIRQSSSRRKLTVRPYKHLGPLTFGNTNRLLGNRAWKITVSKTGYINESGRCLVMRAKVDGRELTFVLLNSFGKLTPYGDSNRIRQWIKQETKKSRAG